jgi:hypothetical protein
MIQTEKLWDCSDIFRTGIVTYKSATLTLWVFNCIHRIPSRPPSLFLWGRTCTSAGEQKALQCILQLSKCRPADAHGAMETKMAACWEYDEDLIIP